MGEIRKPPIDINKKVIPIYIYVYRLWAIILENIQTQHNAQSYLYSRAYPAIRMHEVPCALRKRISRPMT
jgi:hypothetical protein